jgi:hypothetical protein
MALTKKPALPKAIEQQQPRIVREEDIARYIEGAPDGKGAAAVSSAESAEPSTKEKVRPKKISLNMAPWLLARIDRIAEANGTTRAATIALACVAYAKEQESN